MTAQGVQTASSVARVQSTRRFLCPCRDTLTSSLAAALDGRRAGTTTLVSVTSEVEVDRSLRGRLRLAAGHRPLVLLGAAGPRVRPGGARRRPRGDLARRAAVRRRRRGMPAGRRRRGRRGAARAAGGRRAGLARRLRLRPRGRRLLDLVLAVARLAGPARGLALPQRGPRLPHRQRGRPAGRRGRDARASGWPRGSPACARRRRCRCSTRTRPPTPRSAAPGPRASSKPPSRRATARIAAGEMSKVVLAREVIVERRRRPRSRRPLRRHARAVPGLLLLLLRHPGGRLHRRQPRAARAPLGRRRLHRRPRRLDPPQL